MIINSVNGKVYVGQSKNPDERKKMHWYFANKNSKHHLYHSMHCHGSENFSFDIIEECEDHLADDREKFWISFYDARDPNKGYNLESGGQGGKNLSDETKKKISESLKGKKFSEERCKNISQAIKGKPKPNLRKENNPKRSEAISKSLTGRSLSEEHKAAVSASLTQYFETHEVRHTEESRRNMSDAQKIIGARKTAAATVDPSHPDAQPKTCPHCGNSYFPKSLLSHWVKRHVVKKFCSRKCVMLYNNANISEETRQKISEAKSGSQLTEEHKRKISESMKQYRRNKS